MGRAHAVALAREGADVVACDLLDEIASVPYGLARAEDLRETADEVERLGRRVIAAEVDVRDQGQLDGLVARTIDELGGVDILVANAGIWSMDPFWQLTDEKWQDMIDVNLTGVWRSAKAVAPHMIERRRGAMVLISSSNGLEGASAYAHYVAAKHGVIGLMRSIALELGPHDVRCNAVCPGTIDTPINNWQGAYDMMAGRPGGTREDLVEGTRHWSILAGRSVLPATAVSNAVVWLVSDESADITGVALPVDGGHMILPGFNPAPSR
jgi:SDR family mycofactocin-dependent oxidoreductase